MTSNLGVLYLYVKTIERAHSPKHMWERIKLSNNYAAALQQVHLRLVFTFCLSEALHHCLD